MHNALAEPLPDADHMQCTSCHRDLREDELGRHACRLCQGQAGQRLRRIESMFGLLNTTTALVPRRRAGGAPSGPRTSAPLPVGLAVLDLVSPGGAATRLQAIEDSWRLAFGRRIPVRHDAVRVFASWRNRPAADIPGCVAFLGINLERACETYPEIAQDLDDIRRLHDQCTAALDPADRPGRIGIGPCPVPVDAGTGPCGTPLTVTAVGQSVRCPSCGTHWDGAAAWIELRAAQDAAASVAA